jgi:hypothetical protein
MILKKIKYIFSVNLKPYLFWGFNWYRVWRPEPIKTAGGVLFFLWANQKRMH